MKAKTKVPGDRIDKITNPFSRGAEVLILSIRLGFLHGYK
jgi:hypothetical protein